MNAMDSQLLGPRGNFSGNSLDMHVRHVCAVCSHRLTKRSDSSAKTSLGGPHVSLPT
jgi:hypothetical protein